MPNEKDVEVIETMKRYGGSFVRSLAATCYVADEVNLEKIKTAFPDLWIQYGEYAETLKDRKKHRDLI